MGNSAPLVITPSENQVLTKIEMVSDLTVRNALLSMFFWRLGTQSAVNSSVQLTTKHSS